MTYGVHASCHRGRDILTSKNTKRRTVFGPRRINAGVQPLKRNLGPSSRNDRVKTLIGVTLEDCEGMIKYVNLYGDEGSQKP